MLTKTLKRLASTLTVKSFEYLAETSPEFKTFLKFLSADNCHLIMTSLLNVGEKTADLISPIILSSIVK